MKSPTVLLFTGIFATLIANISKETKVAWRDTPGTQEQNGMVMLVKSSTGHENFIRTASIRIGLPPSDP